MSEVMNRISIDQVSRTLHRLKDSKPYMTRIDVHPTVLDLMKDCTVYHRPPFTGVPVHPDTRLDPIKWIIHWSDGTKEECTQVV